VPPNNWMQLQLIQDVRRQGNLLRGCEPEKDFAIGRANGILEFE
jgi:hypothetical protein